MPSRRVPDGPRTTPPGVVIGNRGFLYRQARFGQRDVDDLAVPGDAAAVQRGQRPLGAEHAGQAVAQRQRQPGWRPAGETVEVPQPAGRFGHRGVTGLVCVGPGLPVARHPDQDDARVALAEHVVTQVPLLQRAGTEVLHHDVGFLDQIKEQLAAARSAQVQRDGLLVASVHRPENVVPVDFGLPPGPQRIRCTGWFHLDDLGAHVAEQSAGERTGDQRAQLEHPDAVQRPVGVSCAPAKSWRTSQSVTISTAWRNLSR